MNIAMLQPLSLSHAISAGKADEKDVDVRIIVLLFCEKVAETTVTLVSLSLSLFLWLLNKCIHARLSPDPLNLSHLIGKGTYLFVATSR